MAATLLSDLQVKVAAMATDRSDQKPSKVVSMDTRPSEQFDLETGVNAVATNFFESKTEGTVTVTNPVAAKTKVASEDTPSYQEVSRPKTFLDDGRPQLDDNVERSDHEVKWEELWAAKSRYLQQQERRLQDSPSCTTMGFSRDPALVQQSHLLCGQHPSSLRLRHATSQNAASCVTRTVSELTMTSAWLPCSLM
jgi:hypothetical protein